jgi:hypothetical protein
LGQLPAACRASQISPNCRKGRYSKFPYDDPKVVIRFPTWQNDNAAVCPETGATIADSVSADLLIQKLTGLNEILYHTSSSEERADIISRVFDRAGRPSHFDRITQKLAVEIDVAMTKVEAVLHEQEQALQGRLQELERQPEYIELKRVRFKMSWRSYARCHQSYRVSTRHTKTRPI